MDIIELRADILQLRAQYEPLKLEKEGLLNDLDAHNNETTIEELRGGRRLLGTPIVIGQTSTLPVTNAGLTKNPELSFLISVYPCYVISLRECQCHDRLPVHEDALKSGKLDVLTTTSTIPNSAFTFFISQNWDTLTTVAHPDNDRNTKLLWLKNLYHHMNLPDTVTDVWIWCVFPFFSHCRAYRLF